MLTLRGRERGRIYCDDEWSRYGVGWKGDGGCEEDRGDDGMGWDGMG